MPLRRLSDRIGFTEYLSPSQPRPQGLSPGSIYRIIHDAREGDAAQVRTRIAAASARRLLGPADQAVIGAAQAFLDYGAGPGAPLLVLGSSTTIRRLDRLAPVGVPAPGDTFGGEN